MKKRENNQKTKKIIMIVFSLLMSFGIFQTLAIKTISAEEMPTITSAISTGYISVQINWGAISGASYYEIYRSTTATGTYSKIGTTTETIYANSGLVTGKIYYYKVCSVYSTGGVITKSSLSAYKAVKPIPSTPVISSALSISYNTIRISWVPITGAGGYRIYRATSATGTYSYIGNTTKNYYYNSPLVTGRTYYYKIIALHLEGTTYIYSNYSGYKYIKPVPGTPQIISATLSNTTIKLSWLPVTGATGYKIYRATSLAGTYIYAGTTTGTSYINGGLSTSENFYYKVYAYHLEGTTQVLGNSSINKYSKLIPYTQYISGHDSLALLEKTKIAKGGFIGTNGKGVVSLRFDDYQNVFKTSIYPLLISRNLPCSMALISRFNTAQLWGNQASWSDIQGWNKNGVEIWSHGTDHNDYTPRGYTGLFEQVVTSREEIENHDIKVVGWALPGVYPKTNILPYNGLTEPGDYNSTVGGLLMHTYPLTEAYAYGPRRILPSNIYHGMGHITVPDYTSLAAAKLEVDYAIRNKTGIEIMCHSGNFGRVGVMTLSEYKQLLDYIKYQWDMGNIEVLTPSGMYMADPNSNLRLNLISTTDLDNLNNMVAKDNYKSSLITITGIKAKGYNGEQFMVDGWYKSGNANNTSGYIRIYDSNNSSNLNIQKTIQTNGQNLQHIRFIMSVPVKTDNLSINFVTNGSGVIVFDQFSIKIL